MTGSGQSHQSPLQAVQGLGPARFSRFGVSGFRHGGDPP